MPEFGGFTDEELSVAVTAFAEHGAKQAAADALGITRYALLRRLKRAAERGMMGTEPVLPGFRISKTAAVTDKDGDVVRQFVQQRPELGPEFELPPGHVVKGISALTDADGRVVQQWVKTQAEKATQDVVAALKETFEQYRGRAELVPSPAVTDGDLMSVYPIADLHHGLLAWGEESGEDYDIKIGSERLRACVSRLVGQSPASRGALLLNLGDYFHNDDSKNMTPRGGNILDVDSRYVKVVRTGVQLMMDVIELALAKHETVLVRNLPGNHDIHSSVALTVALLAFYASNPRVIVDDDPSEWFYHRYGATLIGAHHGHRAKPADMAMNMAVSRREDWGATKYHWFLYGHIHHESAKEVGDVRCESFQTLAAKDAYSAANGYTSGQSITSVTLHREDGEIGRHRVNVAPALRKAA